MLQSTCVESQLEAGWSITNITAGSSAHTEAALATAPCLIQLLRSGSEAVQEQCVWALGNMAGDNPDFRSFSLVPFACSRIVRGELCFSSWRLRAGAITEKRLPRTLARPRMRTRARPRPSAATGCGQMVQRYQQ